MRRLWIVGLVGVLMVGVGALSAQQTVTYQQITVGTTSVNMPDVARGSTVCRGTLEDANIRMTIDGQTPTASFGQLIKVGDEIVLQNYSDIVNWKGIQAATGSAGKQNFHCGIGTPAAGSIVLRSISSFVDNSAFTFGTTAVTLGAGVLDDVAPNAATENRGAAVRISTNRMFLSQIGDGAGNERRANVTAGNALVVDGSAVTQPSNVAQWGGVAIVSGRCQRQEPVAVTINQTANTQLITGVTAQRIYICSAHLVTASTQNVALVSGTGATCGTGTAGMTGFGGPTAATGWNFGANGGLVLPPSSRSWGQTAVNADNVCLLQSGAGQLSGGLTYVSLAP